MANGSTHNEQDPESTFGSELRERLEQAISAESSRQKRLDSFVQALLDYRSALAAGRSLPVSDSEELWGRIAEELGAPGARSPRHKLTLAKSIGRWAIAAAACISVVFGLYTWLNDDHERFVVASGAGIEEVILSDGSRVTLRPHSSLVEIASDKYRLDGEALFEVTKDPNREFVLETDVAEVTVLGTTFDVSTWANETHVFLAEGRVTITHAEQPGSLTLEPGQAAIVDRNMISRPVSDATESNYLDWLHSELSFDRSPSYRVAAELGHHFGVVLEIPAELANATLSGRILLSTLDQGLEDLATVLGGRFEPLADSSFVFVTK